METLKKYDGKRRMQAPADIAIALAQRDIQLSRRGHGRHCQTVANDHGFLPHWQPTASSQTGSAGEEASNNAGTREGSVGDIMANAWKVNCKASIAGWSIDSSADPKTELISLELSSSLLSAADRCALTLYAPPPRKKGLLEEAVGEAVGAAAGALGLSGGPAQPPAFSIKVRGQDVKHGDQLMIELAAGDRSGKVATMDVCAMTTSLGETRIAGATGKSRLALTRLNQVYQNHSLSQIVEDLASQAQVSTGIIETGNTYSYLVIHESKNVLTHIRELALREGKDVFFDPDNRLNITGFTKTKADHTFTYGIDILDVVAQHDEPLAEHVVVCGESPASNQGTGSWYWLAKDLSPFRADLGSGMRLLPVGDRAIRTKDAADLQSKAKLGAIKDQASTGRVTILGNPEVLVSNAIEIKSVPWPQLNGLFKVASVTHRYSKRYGYVTSIGFMGQGAAKATGGILGQTLGALRGAVGL
jgi:hypothetical protein